MCCRGPAHFGAPSSWKAISVLTSPNAKRSQHRNGCAMWSQGGYGISLMQFMLRFYKDVHMHHLHRWWCLLTLSLTVVVHCALIVMHCGPRVRFPGMFVFLHLMRGSPFWEALSTISQRLPALMQLLYDRGGSLAVMLLSLLLSSLSSLPYPCFGLPSFCLELLSMIKKLLGSYSVPRVNSLKSHP
jgi:hypothetical protein